VSGGSIPETESEAELVIRKALSASKLEVPLEVCGRTPITPDAMLVGSNAALDPTGVDGAVTRERGGDSNGIRGW
jgi:hypothetical protein